MKLNGNKSAKSRRKKRKSPLAVILCTVLGLIVLSTAAYMVWESPPKHDDSGFKYPSATAAPDSPDDADPEPSPEELSLKNTHNDDIYTFLIVGMDKVGANTDTILVGSLNTRTHKINVVSIPRDTLVNIPNSIKKVNVLYESDLNSGGNGVDGLKSGIHDLLGFSVDCYAIIDLTAFEKLVDAIGGVYYDVPIDMYYNDPTQNLNIAIPKGYQWLSGEDALKVVRYRKGYADADIGRIRTQQDFLKSVAEQMLSVGNIPNLSKVSDIITKYVDTDLTAANISFFAREFLLCKSENISFHTMPGNYTDSVGGFSYVSLYPDEWLQMVNDYLNPWSEEVTEENVNILTRKNGALYATTGVIAGGEASFLTMEEYLASLR